MFRVNDVFREPRIASSILAKNGSWVYRAALAGQHHQTCQLDEAMLYYQWIVNRRPNVLGARNNLGVAVVARGRFDEAAASSRK
jgi:hypothetical protein